MEYFFNSGEIDLVISLGRFLFGFIIATCICLFFQRNINKKTILIGIAFGFINDPIQGVFYDFYKHINNNSQIGMIAILTLSIILLSTRLIRKKDRTISRILFSAASFMTLTAWLVIHYSMVYVKMFDERDGIHAQMRASALPMIIHSSDEMLISYCRHAQFDCLISTGTDIVKTDDFDSATVFYDKDRSFKEQFSNTYFHFGDYTENGTVISVYQNSQSLTKEGAFVWIAFEVEIDGILKTYQIYDRVIYSRSYATSRVLLYFWLTGVMVIWIGGSLYLVHFHNKRFKKQKA